MARSAAAFPPAPIPEKNDPPALASFPSTSAALTRSTSSSDLHPLQGNVPGEAVPRTACRTRSATT